MTRDVVLWLEEKVDFPKWTTADIETMPSTHIRTWAVAHGVALY